MTRTRVIALAVLGLGVFLALGLSRLTTSSHYSVYFDANDPSLVAHRQIQSTFGRDESMLILLHCDDGDFLEPDRWFVLETLSDALRELANVNAVIAASELNIGGVVETSSGQLIPDRAALVEHGRVFGLLLSEDAGTAALLVDATLPAYDATSVLSLSTAVRAIVDRFTVQPGLSASYTGTLALSAAYVDVVKSDLRVIMPLLLVSILVLLVLLLADLRVVLATIGIGVLATIAGFGSAGWLGATLAAINSFAPIMILSISVAGCVHLVLAYGRLRDNGASPKEAALSARRQIVVPMSIANGTTVVGFLALLLSPSPPLRVVGYTVAIGVAASWFACVTILPGLLERLDPKRAAALDLSRVLAALAARAIRHSGVVVALLVMTAGASAVLVTGNRVSDSVIEYFSASHPFAAATRSAERELVGVNEILYELDTGRANGLLNTSTLGAVASFTDWLRKQPEVRSVSSLLDVDVVRAAGGSQSLLDRFSDVPVAETARRELAADRSAMLVAVYLEHVDSRRIVLFDQRAREAAEPLLPDIALTIGGASLIFARLGESNIRSMLVALSAGLLIAALLFGLALRSWTIGVVGLLCNVLPVMTVYGAWAVLDGRISLGAATVMGMILGIVIDDTVFLLTAWWRQRHNADAAVRAVASVGPALVTTTLVLAVGLSAGLLSGFLPVWSMSALSVAIIVTALGVDVIGLPALLGRIDA